MKLPKGITGFGYLSPQHSAGFITKVEQKLAAISRCRILEVHPPQPSNNYYSIDFEYFSKQQKEPLLFSLLVNAVYKRYALIDTRKSEWMQLHFVNPPMEISQKLGFLLEAFTLEQLKLPIEQLNLSELAPQELNQINYWKSKTLGSIVFNGYD